MAGANTRSVAAGRGAEISRTRCAKCQGNCASELWVMPGRVHAQLPCVETVGDQQQQRHGETDAHAERAQNAS